MYSNGKKVEIGDVVKLHRNNSSKGIVKAILHKELFAEELNKETWSKLDTPGYLIDTEYGLILYEEIDEDITLISRGIQVY